MQAEPQASMQRERRIFKETPVIPLISAAPCHISYISSVFKIARSTSP